MDDRLELHSSKLKLGGLFILFSTIGIFSFWMGVQRGEFIGIVATVLFGLACFGVVKQYLKSASVVVDSKGIQDSRWSWEFVPWEDIDSIWVNQNRYYTALCIEFKNPGKYSRQMSEFESYNGPRNLDTQKRN